MESGYTKISGPQVMGVHRVISESRACQPCGKDGCNGSKVSDCLMNLDFENIKCNIKDMLYGQVN
jgi:heptosyltransferase-3